MHSVVAGLPAIAWKAIDERAARYHIPGFMVRTALALPSGNGQSYAQRIDSARTEEDLSRTFEDLNIQDIAHHRIRFVSSVRLGLCLEF